MWSRGKRVCLADRFAEYNVAGPSPLGTVTTCPPGNRCSCIPAKVSRFGQRQQDAVFRANEGQRALRATRRAANAHGSRLVSNKATVPPDARRRTRWEQLRQRKRRDWPRLLRGRAVSARTELTQHRKDCRNLPHEPISSNLD